MRKLLLTVAGIALSTQANAAVNLLQNGSFELGADGLQGWTVTDTYAGGAGHTNPVVLTYNNCCGFPQDAFGENIPTDNASGPDVGSDPVGTHGLYFSSDQATQTLSQSITVVGGSLYQFGFDYYIPLNGQNNPNNATFTAKIGDEYLAIISLGTQTVQTWQTAAGTHVYAGGIFNVATSGTFNFSFSAEGYPAKDIVVDRVYLESFGVPGAPPPSVPEVATWAMMLLGFGAIGAAARRKRTSLTFA